jgi:hypothetical protein
MNKRHNVKLCLAAVLLIPAFLLWKISVNHLFVPVVISAADSWVKIHHAKLVPVIKYNEPKRLWEIQTNLFIAAKPWLNNTYSPNLDVSGSTFISIGHIGGVTLGLPLFWVFIVVYSRRRLKHGLIGTGIILVLSCITAMYVAELSILSALNSEPLLRSYINSYIVIPHNALSDWLWVFKPFRDILAAVTLFIAPVVLCFYFNNSEHAKS